MSIIAKKMASIRNNRIFIPVGIIGIALLIGIITIFPKIYASPWITALRSHFQPTFKDIIDKSGIIHKGSAAGVSFVDYNTDGLLDIFIAGSDQIGNVLYRNNGDGTFTDVTKQAGIANLPKAETAAFGDYDNDGCVDLYLSRSGSYDSVKSPGQTGVLYHNNCDGTFTDVSLKAGITIPSHARGAAWADFDNDGYLDLYIANLGIVIDAARYTVEPNILYHNNGNGTFTDVAKSAGVEGFTDCKEKEYGINNDATAYRKKFKESYQPVWFDYNNDGKMDLFVTTDWGISPLYRNDGNGHFTDVTEEAGLCRQAAWMGAAVGDYNNDGFFDLSVTNIGYSVLWKNNGNGTFTDVTKTSGLTGYALGWGTEFFDYDNDGNEDLFVVNGIVTDEEIQTTMPTKKDFLYHNNGNGTFTQMKEKTGLTGDESKDGAAVGDVNNDGFPDIFVVTDYKTDPVKKISHHLYKNSPNGNHWITLHLRGTKSNRDAIGAKVKVTAGRHVQWQQISAGSSFQSQRSPWLTFGLGHIRTIDTIEIFWPSGMQQKISQVQTDQQLTITENE